MLVLAGAASAVVLLRPHPVLLDPDDLPGVERAVQGERTVPPGWTSCDLSMGPWIAHETPGTMLDFGGGTWAAASIAEYRPDTGFGSLQDYVDVLRSRAEQCGQPPKTDHGFTIEPLPGLVEGEVGWRTGYVDPLWWGQYLLVPLDEDRMLVVGFETREPEPPFDWDRLVALAEQGAAGFPATD